MYTHLFSWLLLFTKNIYIYTWTGGDKKLKSKNIGRNKTSFFLNNIRMDCLFAANWQISSSYLEQKKSAQLYHRYIYIKLLFSSFIFFTREIFPDCERDFFYLLCLSHFFFCLRIFFCIFPSCIINFPFRPVCLSVCGMYIFFQQKRRPGLIFSFIG